MDLTNRWVIPDLIRNLSQLLTAKTVRIMKLTSVLLLVASLHVCASGHSQGITISKKGATLESVFKEIEKQTDYEFFYRLNLVPQNLKVDVDLKNASINETMAQVLKGLPLTFEIVNKTIVVKAKEESPNVSTTNEQKLPIDISGKVTDKDGNPLVDANVIVKGKNIGVKTDVNGVFVLKGLSESDEIIISFTGYTSQTIKVGSNTSFLVKLELEVQKLTEVVVNKGYYTEKQKFSVANTGHVDAKEIEKQPITNPLLALVGRVPGLFMTQSTGLPNSGIILRIQGQNSIANGADPLYVIDGVPFVSQMLPTLNKILGTSDGTTTSGGGNPLSFLNPADIQSIEVLKDADATAIYGSKAAAGAILITTKQGKAGETRVSVNLQSGWGKITRKLDLLNTDQYLEMRREAFRNDGLPIPNHNTTPATNNYDLTVWDTTRYTDWQKELIGGTAKYLDIQTQVSSGSASTQFLIAPGYHRETTVFPGDLYDEKASLHFSINNVSSNKKFQIQFSGNYQFDNNKVQRTDLTGIAIKMAPNAPKLYNDDGSLNWEQFNGNSTWANPLAYMNSKYQVKTENLLSNLMINYQFSRSFSIKSNFGYTNLESNEIAPVPLSSLRPENRPTGTLFTDFSMNSIHSWIMEPQANFLRSFGKNKFETLIGTTFQQQKSNGSQIEGYGYTSEVLMEDLKSAPSLYMISSLNSVYNYNAIFGRINYNHDEEYILNVVVRRDGSSRFGSNNLFHNFWSSAGGWIFTRNKFVQKNIKFLSFGKIKMSYGTTGSEQIGDYRFMNLYSTISAATPYQGATGLVTLGLPNPNVQWEETKKLQGGIELGFINNRILLTAIYYRNQSSNQLLAYPLPGITGFTSISSYNLPATIRNYGFEFSGESRNYESQNFRWSTNINLTIPKNKLISYPDISNSVYASSLVVGQPFNVTKAYRYLGVDPATGLYLVADANGNPTSKPATNDRTVLILTSPKFYGGFGNVLNYKGFELSFLFQFVKQFGSNYTLGDGAGQMVNQPVYVLQRWQKPGDLENIQRYSTGGTNAPVNWSNANSAAKLSDVSYSDASFVRLKNLSVSWDLPRLLAKRYFLSNARVYVHGQNLLTITNYTGMDPENKSLGGLPPLRVITVGIQSTF